MLPPLANAKNRAYTYMETFGRVQTLESRTMFYSIRNEHL